MKKKVKIYMLMGGEPYEPDYCFGVYSKIENAKKALKRMENNQFYDNLNDLDGYCDNMIYRIREHEIKDLFNEEET